MFLTLVLWVLLIAITIRQAIQGFFSALILTVLTVCCAAAALGTYEWVAIHWVAPYFMPSYAMAIALAGVFGVPALILYIVFATVIKRSCLLPAWADRIGGGVCGVVSGMVIVGIAATSLQMIPFDGGRILGFARYNVVDPGAGADATSRAEAEHNIFLRPDGFAVSLVSILSDGVFSGESSFYEVHPDLLQNVGWVGAAPAVVSRYAPPGSIAVAGTEPVPFVYKMVPGDARAKTAPTYEPEPPTPGHEFRMVKVRLLNEARDEKKSHIFTLRQFRLVGRERSGTALDQYHPVAIQQTDANDPTNRHIRAIKGRDFVPVMDQVYSPRDTKANTVEIVFDLPEGFKPTFLEYKRGARASLSFDKKPARQPETTAAPDAPLPHPTASAEPARAPTPPPAPTQPAPAPAPQRRVRSEPPPETNAPPSRRGGSVRGVTTVEGESRFSDAMPLTLTRYRRLQNTEIERGALSGGHLVAELDQQEGGTDAPVTKFVVPEDKRLLQLSLQKLQARSGLGKALSTAVQTVQNYTVRDANGNDYLVVGKYAAATVEGVPTFEVVYFSEPTGSMGGLGKFDKINEQRDLKPTDNFVLLFLVEPGAEIVSFSSGGSASREDDLRPDKLIAPP